MSVEIYIHQKILDYLQLKHMTLQKGYLKENGETQECTKLAIEIAQIALDLGLNPHLVTIRGLELPNSNNVEMLIPKIYKGKVRWGGHKIAAIMDIALDPLVGRPLSLRQYSLTVFERPVIAESIIASDRIEEFIAR